MSDSEAPALDPGLDIIAGSALPRSLKHALSTVHRFVKRYRNQCDASERTLARNYGVSARQWRRIVRRLIESSVVRCEERPGRPSILVIDYEAVKSFEPSPKGDAPLFEASAPDTPNMAASDPGHFGPEGMATPDISGQEGGTFRAETPDILGQDRGHFGPEPRTSTPPELKEQEKEQEEVQDNPPHPPSRGASAWEALRLKPYGTEAERRFWEVHYSRGIEWGWSLPEIMLEFELIAEGPLAPNLDSIDPDEDPEHPRITPEFVMRLRRAMKRSWLLGFLDKAASKAGKTDDVGKAAEVRC